MNAILGKRVSAVLALCALSLCLTAAVPGSADAPQTLYNESWVTGELTGNRAGAFARYAINYPGDGSVVTIELHFAPADPVTKRGFGFNVYGPNGFLIGQAVFAGDRDGQGVLLLQCSDRNPATWLVQVHNYIPEDHVAFSMVARGLPVTQPQPAKPAETESAPQALSNEKWLAGELTGNRAGVFGLYTISYPGDGSVVTIELRFAPADPVTQRGFGFNVYGPNGLRLGRAVFGGERDGDGVLLFQYSDHNPATWLVQVYNYVPDDRVGYGIVVRGLQAPQLQPAKPATKSTPKPAEPVPLLGSGYLTGSAGGTYTYYGLTVADWAGDVQLIMTCWPDDASRATGVGFVIYGPAGEAYRGTANGTAGERRATLTAKAPGKYKVQVYNYVPGLTISYALRSMPAGK